MAYNLLDAAIFLYNNDLMKLLKKNPELHKTVKGMFMQVGGVAGGTIIGATIYGRLGGFMGGVIGGVVGYNMCGDYQSLYKVLQDLSDEDKAELKKLVLGPVEVTMNEAWNLYLTF